MGAVGVLAGGRLVTIPGVIPEIDASALTPSAQIGARIPLLVGVSDGGDPSKIYTFSSFDEAKTLLRSGNILSYIARVFAPSPDLPGASSVKFIRASATAHQAALTSGALTFTSRDFGIWTNGIRVSVVQDGSGDSALPIASGNFKPWTATVKTLADKQTFSYYLRSGLLITSPAGKSFDVNFTDQVVALMTDSTVDDEVPFAVAPTLRDVAAWINGHTGWTATVVGPAYYPTTILNSGETAIGVSAIFCPAEAGLLLYLINGQNPLVLLALSGAPGALSGVAEAPLAGGVGRSYDTLDSTSLNAALALAATTTAHGLFVQSAASAIQQLALAHCVAMCDPSTQKYRVLFAGMNFTGSSPNDAADGSGATDSDACAAAIVRAESLDGPAVLAFNGSTVPNPLTGLPEQLGGLGLAAQAVGLWAGSRTAVPLTNKPVVSSALEFPAISKSLTEDMLAAGVFTAAFNSDNGQTRVVKAVTCYQSNNPAFFLLQGLTIQHTILRLWQAVLSRYVGGPLDLADGQLIKADCAAALDRSVRTGANPDGFLTEGRLNGARLPAWEGLSVTGDSTLNLWSIDVTAHPVGEADFIRVTTKLTPVPIQL